MRREGRLGMWQAVVMAYFQVLPQPHLERLRKSMDVSQYAGNLVQILTASLHIISISS
jgi:hypothetical protein